MEAERRRRQAQMVELARRLGMADVASSMLHNMRNVLNSMTVSVGVFLQGIQRSLIADVERIADHLQAHHDHLETFLARDPRSRKIPEYLIFKDPGSTFER